MKKYILVVLVLIFFSACASKKMDETLSPHVLFNQAFFYLKNGKNTAAMEIFKKIEAEYPYDEITIDVEAIMIWVYYQEGEDEAAKGKIDNFLKFYPYNKYTQWAEYMRGVVAYDEIPYYKKDTESAYGVLSTFENIMQKYPDSQYAKDVFFKSIFVKQVIAAKSMDVGNYYLRHKNYIGAMYRFQDIIKHFDDSIFVAESLYRLVTIYITLDDIDEAKKTYIILNYNYPQSKWAKKARSLVNKYENKKVKTKKA